MYPPYPDDNNRRIETMKYLKALCLAFMLVCLSGSVTYAKENFPINIAVEFTDHAASAYIAQHKGWFEEEGIKPTFYSYITGMSLAAALGRGDIQAAYVCLLPAINAYANARVPIKVVTGLHKHGYGLTVNPARIKSVKDMERSDIRIGAVQIGGPVDAVLLKTIEKYGLDRSKILNKVQRMNPPMQIMAIKMAKLDASFNPEHWPAMAEEAGFKVLLSSQDVWPDMQGSVLVVKEELVITNPEIVRKLVKITAKATKWIKENPENAASIMAEYLQVTGDKVFPVEAARTVAKLVVTPQIMRRSMKRLDYTIDVDPKTIQESIDFAAQHGYIKNSFSARDILDLRFSK
jgi:NitT/TauT family transport system substrate-binding protein